MMSEYLLEQIAKENPFKLKRLLSQTADTYTLTYGLEILGEVCQDLDVPELLLKFLSHPNPVVVEGSLLGIEKYFKDSIPNKEILLKLDDISHSNSSKYIRQTAAEILEDFKLSNDGLVIF